MTRMLPMIFLGAAAARLAFAAYMLFSWARLIAAFVLFLVPLPLGFLIKPMLLCFWLAPCTTGSAVFYWYSIGILLGAIFHRI